MVWPISETLERIESYAPPELVSSSTFSQLRALANFLPDWMSSYYLECRLAEDRPQIDFLLSSTLAGKRRERLAGKDGMKGLPDILLRHPLWGKVSSFLLGWADSTSLLYEQVPLIWLEFDNVNETLPEIPLPCFSFCLDSEYLRWNTRTEQWNTLSIYQYQQLTDAAFERLYDCPFSSQTRQILFACFDALPIGGQIIHMSAMLSRRPAPLKVYGAVPRDRLTDYLQKICWTGAIDDVNHILSAFCIPDIVGSTVYVDLTVDDAVLPKIGIAFSQQHVEWSSRHDPKRRFLLDQCVRSGLCTFEKREALLHWPGESLETFRHTDWPARLRRWLDIKIVSESGQPLEAKGYLGFMPQFSLF